MLMHSFLRDASMASQNVAGLQNTMDTTAYKQANAHAHPPQSVASASQNSMQHNTSLVRASAGGESVDMPSTLEQFREYVRMWLDLDNTVKKAQKIIKEKRQQRDQLSLAISKFMCKYDIEDLNTKEGRIRCKVTQVKAPLNQRAVKEKISSLFEGDEEKSKAIIKKLYEERDTVQKVSLRRLKIE